MKKERERMSLLTEYEQRTAWKYEPIRGSFHTADGLNHKVDADGEYVPFSGSTVVFRPEKRCVRIVQLMQDILHQKLDDAHMLARPLPASTIHMTLHDLISPETCICGTAEEYSQMVAQSVRRAAGLTETLRREYAGRKLRMVCDRIVNMVSKSLVVMLRPQTEDDFELLLDWYRRFDEIQPLSYPLTPHITLAYFRPGMIDGAALGQAIDLAQITPDDAPVFEFSAEGLTAQYFLDMQTYMDLPVRICFCCDGGLNRSQMAASIITYLAEKRGLPVLAEARAAYPNTHGLPVSDQVLETLAAHGLPSDRVQSAAQFLTGEDASHFTVFAAMTAGARSRMAMLGLTGSGGDAATQCFYGVRDPEYGEVTYEQAFRDIYDRAEAYLNTLEAAYSKQLGA